MASSTHNLPTTSRSGGLIWMNTHAQSETIGTRTHFLFHRGGETDKCLSLEDDQPGIIAWSLDHDVLGLPVYRGPHDDSSTYTWHKVMLDKYREFSMPQHQATLGTVSHTEGEYTLPGSKDGTNQYSTTKQWSLVHEDLYGSPVKLKHGWMNYKKNLTGNIIRAIEADRQLNETLVQHSLSLTIAQNYDSIRADYNKVVKHTPRYAMPPEMTEVFGAWDEVVKAHGPTKPNTGSWLSEYLLGRLPHYPVQFSVEGAIMVTVPISAADLPSEASYVLRNLAFFELPDPEPSDGGTIHLQLPLLLVKEHLECIYDDETEPPPQYSTRNEQRIATASAAWYLDRLEINDFPVFGLTLDKDGKGYLSQAWVSSTDKCCYVADWNIQDDPFDIGSKSGVDRYKAFLSKLRDHAQELEDRFEGIRDGLLAGARRDKADLRWSTRAQLGEFWHGYT